MRRPHTPTAATENRTFSRRSVALLAVLSVAQLMVILDISAVNVALPDLAKGLGLSSSDLSWTITSYSVVFGSLLLLGGRAADLLGRRRMFMTGLGVFMASSLASALAGGATALFAARAGQGVGAALLSPAALSILMSTFTEGRQRTAALGVWGAVGAGGAAIGVLLGGVLTDLVSWRAIFFINLPVGFGLALAAMHLVPADAARPQWRGLDIRGALMATFSFASIVFAATQANADGWTSFQVLFAGITGLLGLVGFARYERRASRPLVRIDRLTERAIGGGAVMMLMTSAVLFGMFLLTSLYLQNVLGTSPLETGLAFLPAAAITGLGAHLGSHVARQRGVRGPLAVALAITAGGMLLLSGVDAGGSYVSDVLPGLLVAGLGLGMALVYVAISVLTGARAEETGMLSGVNTTGHEVGGSIGVAVLLTIATGSIGATSTPAAVAAGLGDAYLAAAGLAIAASLIALAVLPSAKVFLPKMRLAPSVSIH